MSMETRKKETWTEKGCLDEFRARQARELTDEFTEQQLRERSEKLDKANRIDRFVGLKNGVYRY